MAHQFVPLYCALAAFSLAAAAAGAGALCRHVTAKPIRVEARRPRP